jgi:hypothetical protein
MATWHITVSNTLGQGDDFQGVLHTLVLRPVRSEFEQLGFRVEPMPEGTKPALTVSHTNASAITLYMLTHNCEYLEIVRQS